MAIRFRFRFRSMQSALEGIDMRVEGKKLGANYVSDVALPLVLRMQLAQPIIAGDDATDFCVAERSPRTDSKERWMDYRAMNTLEIDE